MTGSPQPAAWHADPTGRHQYRYWDGSRWTDQVADDQVTSTDPPTMPVSGAAPAVGPDPAAPPAAAGAPVPSPIPPVARAPKRAGHPVWAWIAALGGLALVVGAFLDAASASLGNAGFSVSVDKNYLDGDGPIEIVLGVGIVVLALLLALGTLPRWGGWLVVGLGVVGALVAVADIADVQDDIDKIERLGGSGSVGPALWVCLAGGIIAVAGGVLTFALARPADAPPTGGPAPTA